MHHHYDVLIVGGRVAGSSLAAYLGDCGHRVLLIDRSRFPSSTLSTHFFRGNGLVRVLSELDILDDALALGAPPLRCDYWYTGGSEAPDVTPPQDPGDIGFALSVRRSPLDDLLLRRALSCGTVELRAQTRFVELLRSGDRVTGAVIDSESGRESIEARMVVGADGRYSSVSRATGGRTTVSEPPIRAMRYCYVDNLAAPDPSGDAGAEFSVVGDEIAYVLPSDGGVTCVALSWNVSAYDDNRKRTACDFLDAFRNHPGVSDRVLASTPVSKVMSQGRDTNYVRDPCGPGWALVGDAGMNQDPWGGLGMDIAGTHARFLAESLDDWLSGRTSESSALAAYRARRDAHGMPLYEETQTIGRNLRQAFGA